MDFPFEAGDPKLVFFKTVKRTLQPKQPALQGPLFSIKLGTEFRQAERGWPGRSGWSNDMTTGGGHQIPFAISVKDSADR